MKIRDTAIAMIHARAERDAAKKALKEYRQQNPECLSKDIRQDKPCYLFSPYQDTWCDVCYGSQPLWTAYQKAATKAGALLRRLMLLCRKETI